MSTESKPEPIDLRRVLIPPEVIEIVPGALARQYGVLPVARRNGVLEVVSDQEDIDTAILRIEGRTGLQVRRIDVKNKAQVWRSIWSYYEEDDSAQAGTPLNMFQRLIRRALQVHSSDVHIDPGQTEGYVRMRIDGILRLDQTLDMELTTEVISAIKVAANLDISEHRVPQDGQITMDILGEEVSMRIAVIPNMYGEKVTVRILSFGAAAESELTYVGHLGMSARHLEIFRSALKKPHGIILMSGPTGSGKTTSQYAGMRLIKESETQHILTIEDPVEIPLQGATQVRIDSHRVDFNAALRSALRHDPDVIMIGEIRDAETADIAVKAALTGHLVLSTLHTNDAAGVVTRLLNLGVSRDLLASTLLLAIAQRLVRQPCPHCVQTGIVDEGFLKKCHFEAPATKTAPKPVGCPLCAETGYAGRAGLFEMIPVDREIKNLILRSGDEGELADMAFEKKKLPTLSQDGAAKVLEGVTTEEEVERVAVWDLGDVEIARVNPEPLLENKM